MIEIADPGPLCTVQDRGRPGYAALGVPRSGAFDHRAAALANRLVGNDESAAVLEVTLGGLRFTAHDSATVALTGAVCGGIEWGIPVSLASGATVRLGTPFTGLRSYLAVRGGIAVDATLGSRSTDLLSGLGPARLRAGDRLQIGRQPSRPVDEARATPAPSIHVLAVHPGPRRDWFRDPSALAATEWTVRAESDRVGIRLDGPPLDRIVTGELPSEPTLPGAIQVPTDGRPVIFGPDAPVTGGYPVIAVLDDLADAAQLRPGDRVRIRWL